MITGIEVPLEAAGVALMAAFALGAMVGRRSRGRARPAAAGSLAGLFTGQQPQAAPGRTARRSIERRAVQAVLHARIDQPATLPGGWDPATREAVLGQIAAVMQAGIRREDRFTRLGGDGFRIVMPGADERAAKGVADRLRRALAQVRLPHSAAAGPFTASFGVAAGRAGDNGRTLVARALAALDAARRSGCDHVIAASEIEEVIYLPAPDPSPEIA